MKKNEITPHDVVLGIDPTVRGFGYAVFEGPNDLVDWGMKNARLGVNYISRRSVSQLIEKHQPTIVVIEATDSPRRCERVRKLLTELKALCKKKNVTCVEYTRGDVRVAFSNFEATTKYEIACKLVLFFPELKNRLPKRREAWGTEDQRSSIFDAVSFAFTYYNAIED